MGSPRRERASPSPDQRSSGKGPRTDAHGEPRTPCTPRLRARLRCLPGLQRTSLAALNIATDLVAEKRITARQALLRLKGVALDDIKLRSLDTGGEEPPSLRYPGRGGVAAGAVLFDPARADEFLSREQPFILLREHASTDDISAIAKSSGLVTRAGARTAHAAVVARRLGKVCLVGCEG